MTKTILCLFLILIGSSIQAVAQKTKHVVIIMMDGARYSETFGDSLHDHIPALWNELRPQGTIYTSFYNNGKTETNPGHSSVLSGTWQYIANDGSERSHSPSIFEYLRKQKGVPQNDLWVALGKDKLNVLTHSTHADYGSAFGASYITSADPAEDLLTYQNVRTVLTTHRSKITIANFARTDIEGHAANWDGYLGGIRRADSLIALLWKEVQSDSVLKNRTTLIITNDHGRHLTNYTAHGDGCDGCRHIMLMVLGPDTPKGYVDSTIYSQIDIAPTIAKMMRFTAPLAAGKVIESAIAAAANIPLQFKQMPAAKIAGTFPLQWSLGAVQESVTTLIEYSNDNGNSWKTVVSSDSKDSSYLWNTLDVPDGTRYRLRIQVLGDTTYGVTQTPQSFTIDNPLNGAPDLELLSPNRNIVMSGTETILWKAADPEENSIAIGLMGSVDNGNTWTSIVNGLPNSGSYHWDTQPFANSKSFRLKIISSDGSASSEIISPRFETENIRLKAAQFKQTAGAGNGIVSANISLAAQLTGDSYSVEFVEHQNGSKSYTVRNQTKNIVILNGVPFDGDGSEGPLFDGLRLSVLDHPEPVHNSDSTRWLKGNSNLFSKVNLPELVLPEGTIQAAAEAADYEIRISDTIADTTADMYGVPPTPVYYTVYNTTLQQKTPFIAIELTPDAKYSFGDDIYLFKKDSTGKNILSWEIFVNGELNSVNPVKGDVYRIATTKPITGQDRYEFAGIPTGVRIDGQTLEQFALEQNYPNPFNPSSTIQFTIPVRSIVSLTIFDLLGREVMTVTNEDHQAGTHRKQIDLSKFSSGIYFYRLSASNGNVPHRTFTDVKKMLLLK